MSDPVTHSSSLAAIDAHGHYGACHRNGESSLTDRFMSAAASEVVERARACGVEWTFVSPLAGLLPRGRADAAAANEAAHSEVHATEGLFQYVIVNPLQPQTFEQARRMLKSPKCVGVKIHPEEHGYRIADHGRALFALFEELEMPVLAHSGCRNSLPADYVPFANEHSTVRLLLAHLGNGAGDNDRPDLQVRAIQAARHQNIWTDTSSARSMLPGLVEWAAKEIGAERLLFGSDTPLYHVALQRARIESAEISFEAKRLILRENAIKFFNLDPKYLAKPA